jgi:hypothetical protein
MVGGEPPWITAERPSAKAIVHMRPGSEAADGYGISCINKLNGKEPLPRNTAGIWNSLTFLSTTRRSPLMLTAPVMG